MHTGGHRSPAGAHAPVPGAGAPQGHSRPSHLAPVLGCCAKTEGRAGHLRSPPAARSLRCEPPGYPGPQRVFPGGHPVSRCQDSCTRVLPARAETRQLRNRGAGGPNPDSPAVVHSHRTPAPPPQPAAAAAFCAHGCYREGPSDPAGAFPVATSRGRPPASARLPGRCSPGASVLDEGSFFPAASPVFSSAQPSQMGHR